MDYEWRNVKIVIPKRYEKRSAGGYVKGAAKVKKKYTHRENICYQSSCPLTNICFLKFFQALTVPYM
jgi:hypothetical protein